jgi:ribonuclease R
MAGYLERLPTAGPDGRLARALHRQAMVLNGRSSFSSEPMAHFGVGEAVYARFTAPMREMVGVFCHKEAIERLAGRGARSREEDEAIRAQVIDAANRSKDVQRQLDREIGRTVVAAVLGVDAEKPVAQRPVRVGTVMGISTAVVHVLLDEPPLDVIVPLREQGQALGGAWLERQDEGARLARKGGGETICTLGDEVRVRAVGEGAVVLVKN